MNYPNKNFTGKKKTLGKSTPQKSSRKQRKIKKGSHINKYSNKTLP